MINQTDTIHYSKEGFDGNAYIELQKQKIKERIWQFAGRLYLEIGWKFMYDSHASRVLPWFLPESKKMIFSSLKDGAEILFCVNAWDIIKNRQLTNEDIWYTEVVIEMLKDIKLWIWIQPHVVISMLEKWKENQQIQNFINQLEKQKFKVWKRYFIKEYQNTEIILSEKWFWQNDYIKLEKNLILVTGAASNSSKMSTCLWQIYLDHQNWIKSWYAKYETFPIRNLPIEHPVNLAYEAATADIWDFNCIDEYHLKAYWLQSTNYNRDIETFKIVMEIAHKIISNDNYMKKYKSPTDMWISNAWFAITNDQVVSEACLQEIQRRKQRYEQMLKRWEWEKERIEKCIKLEKKCKEYIFKISSF